VTGSPAFGLRLQKRESQGQEIYVRNLSRKRARQKGRLARLGREYTAKHRENSSPSFSLSLSACGLQRMNVTLEFRPMLFSCSFFFFCFFCFHAPLESHTNIMLSGVLSVQAFYFRRQKLFYGLLSVCCYLVAVHRCVRFACDSSSWVVLFMVSIDHEAAGMIKFD
jgi:hypothetical protein